MSLLKEAATGRVYRVAHTYTDRGNPHLEGDEFSGWLAINGRTIGMTGGIRPRSYVHRIGVALPAYVVLVTAHISGDYANPWDDVIDDRAGVIRYWGDAKYSERQKTCDAFMGNRCLEAIYDELLVGDRTALPPILHFSRPRPGNWCLAACVPWTRWNSRGSRTAGAPSGTTDTASPFSMKSS